MKIARAGAALAAAIVSCTAVTSTGLASCPDELPYPCTCTYVFPGTGVVLTSSTCCGWAPDCYCTYTINSDFTVTGIEASCDPFFGPPGGPF